MALAWGSDAGADTADTMKSDPKMIEKPPLTDKLARTLGSGVYFDPHPKAPRGFLLRVTPKGARSWCLNYRVKATGRERRLTIGDIAAWPVTQAREEAAKLRREVDAGGDPLGDRQAQRSIMTVAELWADFEREELPRRALATQQEYRSMARDWVLPALGRLKADGVGREDIEKLHRRLTTEIGIPRRANTVRSLCSTLFNWAITRGLCSHNPTRGVKGNPEPGRERYLNETELDRLLNVLETRPPREKDAVDAIRLAMLTGARRGEILGMTWDQVDLDAAVWVKPAATTKQRKLHRTPLSPDAVAVLRRRYADPVRPLRFVFRHGNSQTGRNAIERDWYIIRAAAGLEDVRFHDLRHSFASWLVGEGLSLPIVGAMLGHSKPQTTARYAHLADRPLRQAAEIVANKVRR